MQARGQIIALHGVHLFEIAGGRIVQTTDFWDIDDFKAQVLA